MVQSGWTFDPANPVFTKREKPRPAIINGRMVQAYLWSRTIICVSCTGLIPLSPNWRLSSKLGIRLLPNHDFGVVGFEVVSKARESRGTITKAIATCPLCGTVTPKGYPAQEARANRMGHIEYCRIYKNRYPIYRRNGPPVQGRDALEFVVPGNVIAESDRQRWCYLKDKGWSGIAARNDPLLRELGLFGGKVSEYAPGIEALGLL